MAALSAITPSNSGTSSAGAAVAASDTVAQSIMGPNGALLEIINASGSSDTITISDAGLTPAGNPLASGALVALSVGAGASKVFKLTNAQVNPLTNLITITHTQTPTVTYKLYAI